MESLATRIKIARESKGFSKKQLADKLGISSSAISQYESNSYFKTEPSVKNLIKLSKILGVSAEWLMTGRGIQEIENFLINEKISFESNKKLVRLNKQEKELLIFFGKLSDDWKDKYLYILKAIIFASDRQTDGQTKFSLSTANK